MMRNPPEIIATKPAGDDHQVVTIEDGTSSRYRREPCPTCPWRVDMIGEFPAEAFRQSANTGIDPGRLPWRDDPERAALMMVSAHHVFACHASGPEKPATCAGYIRRGQQALSWRMAATRGLFDPALVEDGDHPLFENYRDMAEANGVDPDDPALDACPPYQPD